MIIELPQMFYKESGRNKYVIVENGILEIHGTWGFEELMIEITYLLKGKRQCYFCKREVNPKKITIDHLFPTDFGGMTITSNLEPACSNCNSTKTNMNEYEYAIWRKIPKAQDKKKFYQKIVEKKRAKKHCSTEEWFDLPNKWVEYRKLDSLKINFKLQKKSSRKFQRMVKFAQKYHKLPRTIVISKNNYVLEGATAYQVAKEMGFQTVPVTVLENVVLYKD